MGSPRAVVAFGLVGLAVTGACGGANSVDLLDGPYVTPAADMDAGGSGGTGGVGGAGGSAGAAGAAGSGGEGGAGGAGGTSPDAGPDDGGQDDGCVPKRENCTNGVDDNCDGKVDCEDPVCSGFVCTAESAPAGWDFVNEVPNGTLYCGQGYGAATAFIGEPTADPVQCGCTCGRWPGTCSATLSAYAGADTGCATPTGSKQSSLSADCGSSDPLVAGSNYELTVATAGATCGPGTSQIVGRPQINAPAYGVCTLQALGGAGCNGGVCAPKPRGGEICIAHDGDVDCPDATYSKKRRLGSNVQDNRACGDCTCGASHNGSCADAKLDVYPALNKCQRQQQLLAEVGQNQCTPYTTQNSSVPFFYAATNLPTCAPLAPPTGTNDVALKQVRKTVCCTP